MNDLNRRYAIHFGASMLAYSVIVLLALGLARSLTPENPLRYAIALGPVVPLIFAFLSYVQFVRRLDEMEQRIQLEAVAISLGCTMLLTLTLGFLESVGFPHIDMIWVPVFIIVMWRLGMQIATRRYR